jgi:hypothetical protein
LFLIASASFIAELFNSATFDCCSTVKSNFLVNISVLFSARCSGVLISFSCEKLKNVVPERNAVKAIDFRFFIIINLKVVFILTISIRKGLMIIQNKY